VYAAVSNMKKKKKGKKDKNEGKLMKIATLREAEVHRENLWQAELKKIGRCVFSSIFGTKYILSVSISTCTADYNRTEN